MNKIYISGHISGLDNEVSFNIFLEASIVLNTIGFNIVNPMIEIPFEEGKEWEQYMIEDINLLLECDDIFMLSNWINSSGAIIEKYISKELGLNVLYEGTDVIMKFPAGIKEKMKKLCILVLTEFEEIHLSIILSALSKLEKDIIKSEIKTPEIVQEEMDVLPKEIQDNLDSKQKLVCKMSDELDVNHCEKFHNCVGCTYLEIRNKTTKDDFYRSSSDDVS